MGDLTGNVSSPTLLILDSPCPFSWSHHKVHSNTLSSQGLKSYFALVSDPWTLLSTHWRPLWFWAWQNQFPFLMTCHHCMINLRVAYRTYGRLWWVWGWNVSFLKSVCLSWLCICLALLTVFFMLVDSSNVLGFEFPWDFSSKRFLPSSFNSACFSLQNFFSPWLWKKWTSQGKEMAILRSKRWL